MVIMLALWATAIPMAFGWKPVSIVSGSMEPLIGVGDVVVAEPYTGQELVPGSVIVFEDPVWGGLISHRLESANADGTLTTKGDANRSADSTPIGLDAVKGIGRILVPEIGWPTVWASVGNTQALVLATVCWLVLLYAARWGAFARFDPWNAPADPEPAEPPPPAPRRRRNRQRGRHLRKRPPSRIRPVIGLGSLLGVVVATLTVGISSAVLASTTANSGNQFAAAPFSPPSNLQLSASCSAGTPIGFRGVTTTSGQGSSFTINKPAGTAAGDTMLIHIVLRDDYALTVPTGWILVRRSPSPGPYSAIYRKTAGASEPASYTWSVQNTRFAVALGTWTNVDTTNPINAQGGQSGFGSSIVAPSITTTVPNTVLVAFWSIRDNTGVTIPGSMTLRWSDNSQQGGQPKSNVQGTGATEAFASSGATGSRTAVSSASEDNVGQLIALKPASSGTPSVSATWTATPSTFATGHKLQRWLGAVQQTEQTITPRTTTTATDSTVTSGQTYTYRLFAYFNTWTSTQISNTVTVPSC